jgi:hypothetical protein
MNQPKKPGVIKSSSLKNTGKVKRFNDYYSISGALIKIQDRYAANNNYESFKIGLENLLKNFDNTKFSSLANTINLYLKIAPPFPAESIELPNGFDYGLYDNKPVIDTLQRININYKEIIDDLKDIDFVKNIDEVNIIPREDISYVHTFANPRETRNTTPNPIVSDIILHFLEKILYLNAYIQKLKNLIKTMKVNIKVFTELFYNVSNNPPTDSRIPIYGYIKKEYETLSKNNSILSTFKSNGFMLPSIKIFQETEVNSIISNINTTKIEQLIEYEQIFVNNGFACSKNFSNHIDFLVSELSESNRELIALQNHIMNLDKIHILAQSILTESDSKSTMPYPSLPIPEGLRGYQGDSNSSGTVTSSTNSGASSLRKRSRGGQYGGRNTILSCDGSMTDPDPSNPLYEYFKVTGIAKTYDELLHDFIGRLNNKQIERLTTVYDPVINYFINNLQPGNDDTKENIKNFLIKLRERSLGQQEWNYYTTVLWYIDNYCDGIDDLYMAKVLKVADYPFLNNEQSIRVNLIQDKYIYTLGDNEYYLSTIDNNPVSKEFAANKFDYRFSDNSTANSKIIMLLNDLPNTINQGEIDDYLNLMKDIKYAPGLMDPKTIGGIPTTEMTSGDLNNDATFIQLCQNINGIDPNQTPNTNDLLTNGRILAKNILIDGINTFIGYFGSKSTISDVEFLFSPQGDTYIGVKMNGSYELQYGDTTIENISNFYKSYDPGYINAPPSNPSWKRLWDFAGFIYSRIPISELINKVNNETNTQAFTLMNNQQAVSQFKDKMMTEIIITLKSFGDSLQVYYKQRWMKEFLEQQEKLPQELQRFHVMPLTSTDKNVGGESLLINSEFWLIGTGIRPHPSFFQKYVDFFGKTSFKERITGQPIIANEVDIDGSKAIVTNAERESSGDYIYKLVAKINENVQKMIPIQPIKGSTYEYEEYVNEEPEQPVAKKFKSETITEEDVTNTQNIAVRMNTENMNILQILDNYFIKPIGNIKLNILSDGGKNKFRELIIELNTNTAEMDTEITEIGRYNEKLQDTILNDLFNGKEVNIDPAILKKPLVDLNNFLTTINDVILMTQEPVDAETVVAEPVNEQNMDVAQGDLSNTGSTTGSTNISTTGSTNISTTGSTSRSISSGTTSIIEKFEVLTDFATTQYMAVLAATPKRIIQGTGSIENAHKRFVALNNVIDDKLVNFAKTYMAAEYTTKIEEVETKYTELLQNTAKNIAVTITKVEKEDTSPIEPTRASGRSTKRTNYAQLGEGANPEIELLQALEKNSIIQKLELKLGEAQNKLNEYTQRLELPKQKSLFRRGAEFIGLKKTDQKKVTSAENAIQKIMKKIEAETEKIRKAINEKQQARFKIISPEEKKNNTISLLQNFYNYMNNAFTPTSPSSQMNVVNSGGKKNKRKITKKKRKQKKHTKKIKFRKKSSKKQRHTKRNRKQN